MTDSPILSEAEVVEITGYRLAPRQLAELKKQGFWRARRSPVSGRVILEREHYISVCTGAGRPKATPKLHLVNS